MNKNLSKATKIVTILSLCLFSYLPSSFAEDNKIDYRIEGDIGGHYNSNLAQIQGFDGDFINAYTATGTFRYLAPSQTQLLARVQGQYNKFIKRGDFDFVAIAGSINLSQWFYNSLNVYVGVQPIQLISTTNTKTPLDIDYLGGLTYYYPFMSDIAYVGYQLDKLNASAQDFSSLNNTFLVGIRHSFTDNFFGNASAKVKLRKLDIASLPGDTRVIGDLSAQYLINDFFTLQISGEYTKINSSLVDKNIGVFDLGVNIIGGYNNGFSF